MRTSFIVSIVFTLWSLLSGCSSGESSDGTVVEGKEVSVSFSGQVVDGPISGATVCIDLDFSGICEVDEPRTYTTADGGFSFSNIKSMNTGFLPLIARYGVDTTTKKNLIGSLQNILYIANLDTSKIQYITPLTDLIAIKFIDSYIHSKGVYDTSRFIVSKAYTIADEYVDQSPLMYAGVFSQVQEIEQTLRLIVADVEKMKAVSFTSVEREMLRTNIKRSLLTEAEASREINLPNVLTNLESLEDISFPQSEKEYIQAQLREIRLSIDAFSANKNLTVANLNNYQVALESAVDTILQKIASTDANTTITATPVTIDIDAILAMGTDSNSSSDNNTTTPDNNTTTPVETNTTKISFSGYMVDGYISDATVCMDMDGNGVCSSQEPSAVTSAEGKYIFSDIEVNKESVISLLGYGGKDSAIDKVFTQEYRSVVSSSQASAITLSPITDLLMAGLGDVTLDTLTLSAARSKLSAALGVGNLFEDPMQNISQFVVSQGIEQIKRAIETVVKNNNNVFLSTQYIKDLRKKIKKILYAQILLTGYTNLDIDTLLSSVEIEQNILLTDRDRSFAIAQLNEIFRVLDALKNSSAMSVNALARTQAMLEQVVTPAYNAMAYTDINITADIVTKSEFSKEGAEYDANACAVKGSIANLLTDSNLTGEYNSDVRNGVTIKSNNGDASLYYPSFIGTLSQEKVFLTQDSYIFAFDRAWAKSNAKVYIDILPIGSSTRECYRAILNTDIPANITLTKVYRYSELK